MKTNIASLIRQLRRSSDLTQQQLADEIGASKSLITKIESGATFPSLERVLEMGRLFDNADELVEVWRMSQTEKAESKLRASGRKVPRESTSKEIDQIEQATKLLKQIYKDPDSWNTTLSTLQIFANEARRKRRKTTRD